MSGRDDAIYADQRAAAAKGPQRLAIVRALNQYGGPGEVGVLGQAAGGHGRGGDALERAAGSGIPADFRC